MLTDLQGFEVVPSGKGKIRNILCFEQIGKPFLTQLLVKATSFLIASAYPLVSGYTGAFK